MKKTKFFLALGTATMAITGIFGTKPAKKFAAPAQIYAAAPYNAILAVISSTSHLTTSVTSNKALFATSAGQALVTLKTTTGTAKTVYFY
jgi:hypothetical protein